MWHHYDRVEATRRGISLRKTFCFSLVKLFLCSWLLSLLRLKECKPLHISASLLFFCSSLSTRSVFLSRNSDWSMKFSRMYCLMLWSFSHLLNNWLPLLVNIWFSVIDNILQNGLMEKENKRDFGWWKGWRCRKCPHFGQWWRLLPSDGESWR